MSPETKVPRTETGLVRLLTGVVEAVDAATTEQDVLHVAVEQICAHTGWPVGHIFVPAEGSAAQLILAEVECLADPAYADALRKDSAPIGSVSGLGVVNRAFRTEEPAWSSDTPADAEHLPASVVEAFEAQGVLAVPIVGQKPIAVLEFLTQEATVPTDMMMGVLGHIGRRIGRTIDYLRTKAVWQESEERFRRLVEDVQDYAIFMLDPDGTIVSWNKGAARIKGYEEEEIIGCHYSCFYPREAVEAGVPEEHLEVAARDDRTAYEGWRIRKDGSQFWASVVITALRDESSELRGYLKVTRDLTERKRAMEELQRREARFRALIENSLDIITIIQEDGVIRYQSPSVERILGYEQDGLVGATAFNRVHPDDLSDVQRAFETLVEKPGFMTSLEFRFRHKDGSWCTLESISKNLLDDPVVEGIVVNSRDITDRRKAEEALRKSEERYRALAESSEVGIWHITEDGYTIYVNDAMCALLEIEGPEELAGKTFHEFFTDDSLTTIEHELTKRRRGIASTYEAEIEGKYDQKRNVLISGAPVSTSNDGVSSFIATFIDITKRVKATKRLKQSEMRLAEAQRLARLGSWEWDIETDTVTWSDELYRIYGLDRETFGATYEGFLERVHEDDREHVDTIVQGAIEKHEGFRFEHRIVRPDGEVRIVQGRGEVIVDESDHLEKMIGTAQDITERVQAEEARRESEARFRTIFDQSAIGISMVGLEGQIVEANPALCEILGYDRSELQGMTFGDVTHSADLAANRQRFDELVAGNRDRYQLEKRYIHKDGSVICARVTVSLVRDKKGQPSFSISMVEDITERKEMEAELDETQHKLVEGREAERTHLARELHDGPIQDLQGINFQLGTLSGGGSDGSEANVQVADIQTSLRGVIQTLRTICGDLRPPTLAPFGLESALRSHAEELQEEFPELSMQLDLMYDGQLLAEPTRLALFRVYQQAMDNVVQHAQAERVTVRFRFDIEEVVVEIEDDGRGFDVPRRWAAFARQGHLGLAGAAERADAIGGSLDVTSAPGEGTLVRVMIPRDDRTHGRREG